MDDKTNLIFYPRLSLASVKMRERSEHSFLLSLFSHSLFIWSLTKQFPEVGFWQGIYIDYGV